MVVLINMIIISVSYILLGMLFTAIYLKLISVLRIDIDDWSCEYPPYGIFFAFWIVLALPIIPALILRYYKEEYLE